ncbi:YD repeat protein [Candidatus Thiomargarita nelsonii]|uniref:YD repeat protein n=1 Tax=Candidatus Thiomargarita nelsonii TaxID=1003181 RepID=A0A176RUC5_9GAMM|nr:YD repeat protein [Candidatus Thiomargarita nelsonii]
MQRLIAVTDSQGGKTEYRYDKFGNRLELRAPGKIPVTSSYDWAGKLISHNGQNCQHDAAANFTTCAGDAVFEYNGENLLKSVSNRIHYQYDGDGYLTGRIVDGDKTTFVAQPLSDIWQPLLAKNSQNGDTFYIWEGKVPLAAINNGQVEFFLQDHLGSVRHIADRRGQITQRLNYGPFGVPQHKFNGKHLQPSFVGLFFDPKASLYLTRARGYSPSFGRFLQRDPVMRVPLGNQQDFSVYAYCGNDPVNFWDINGATPASPYYNPQIPPPPILYQDRNSTFDASKQTQSAAARFLSAPFIFQEEVTSSFHWGGVSISLGVFDLLPPLKNAGHLVNFSVGVNSLKGFTAGPSILHTSGLGQLFHRPELGKPITEKFIHNLSPIPFIGFHIEHTVERKLIGPGQAPLAPTNVGGIYLSGASEALKNLGPLTGIAIDQENGRLILLSEKQGQINLPPLRRCQAILNDPICQEFIKDWEMYKARSQALVELRKTWPIQALYELEKVIPYIVNRFKLRLAEENNPNVNSLLEGLLFNLFLSKM